ncbi:MAG TPA: hypothetical protein VJR92_13865 [Gemmatimonadaceae bacterium]|nr:hypothetical protein [Gemmatimonadaceae bacterium]
MRRTAAPFLLVVLCGCAYFNAVYDAKTAARSGDKQMRAGESYSATNAFRQSAVTAETILYRHPKSRWRAEALYLAGRGFALAGDCGPGLRRLGEYLALPDQPTERRERAEVARASCLYAANQLLPAQELLRPLLESKDENVRHDAALWGGRAALGMGNVDRAQELLATVPGSVALWEFMTAAFGRNDLATAESLLVSRARAGDWRSDVPRYVTTLWTAGRTMPAITIIDLYGRSRAPVGDRVALHFLASDLAAGIGDTAQARRQVISAQRIGVAAAVDAEARARLLALRIRELDQLADVEAAIVRDTSRTRGTKLAPQLRDHVIRMKLFLSGLNVGGVGVYHAAEIARDSLHAFKLAHGMFLSIERDFGDFSLAARALLASRTMFPESTAVYEARVIEKWPRSGGAFALNRADSSLAAMRGEDRQLSRAWDFVARQWDDTIKARRAADSVAAAQGNRRQ